MAVLALKQVPSRCPLSRRLHWSSTIFAIQVPPCGCRWPRSVAPVPCLWFFVGGSMTTKPDNTNWKEALPRMDVEAMPVVFPEFTGFETDAARNFGEDRKHVRRTDKQVLLDARRLKNALQHVGRLPRPREAFHLVTKGSILCGTSSEQS